MFNLKRTTMIVLLISILAASAVTGCGGSSDTVASEQQIEEEKASETAFLGDCAHSFNVAVATPTISPTTWAKTYGSVASINSELNTGECLVTISSPEGGLAAQFTQTASGWQEDLLHPSQLGDSVQNWNAEILDGGYIHYLDGDQIPDDDSSTEILRLADSAPAPEPTHSDTGNGCGAISLWPDTPAGLTNITASGIDCDEVIDQLVGWMAESPNDGTPGGWECEIVPVNDELAYNEVTCEADGAEIRFDSY